MTVYIVHEQKHLSGIYATLTAAQGATPHVTRWQHAPSVKGSRPLWWSKADGVVVEAWELQS